MQNVDSSCFKLASVAFFGRSFAEYEEMFEFTPEQWRGKKVLDVASGPASFAAEAKRHGISVTACDPRYGSDSGALQSLASFDIDTCMAKTKETPQHFLRTCDEEHDRFKAEKLRALKKFAEDYTASDAVERYVKASLPDLPFEHGQFDIALCATLLFVYSDISSGGVLPDSPFDYDFHFASVRELLRVAREVRIYPLKGMNMDVHPYLTKLLDDLSHLDIKQELRPARFRDIKGADQFLTIYSGT